MDVGSVAKVSEVHVAYIFRVEVCSGNLSKAYLQFDMIN
jgi:hypothetical protein